MALNIKRHVVSMVVMTGLLASPVICVSMYPFGVAVGDAVAPVNDDGSTESINLTLGFRFFYEIKSNLYVSMVMQRAENSAKTASKALMDCVAYHYLQAVMFKL